MYRLFDRDELGDDPEEDDEDDEELETCPECGCPWDECECEEGRLCRNSHSR